MESNTFGRGAVLFSVLFLGLALLTGCASTEQAKKVETSGFLGDYSKLQPGGEGKALLHYVKPGVDFKKYNRILFPNVEIWGTPDSKLKDVPAEDLQRLATSLHGFMKQELAKDYTFVDTPGPGVMRLRVALTEAGKSNMAMRAMTTIVPQARLLSGVKKMATGTESWVGSAGIEGELSDSQTGEVLAQAVDKRSGTKSLEGLSTDPWSDMDKIFQFWAEKLRDRLWQARERAL